MYEACIIMDFVAIAIVILVILGWIISKAFRLRGEGRGWAPSYERPPSPRELRPERTEPRWLTRKSRDTWRRSRDAWQRSKQSEAWKRKEAAAVKAAKKYDKLVRGAERRARVSGTEARQQRYLDLARKLERRRDMEIRRAPTALVLKKRAEEARIKKKAKILMEKEKKRHIRRARRAEKLRRKYATQ